MRKEKPEAWEGGEEGKRALRSQVTSALTTWEPGQVPASFQIPRALLESGAYQPLSLSGRSCEREQDTCCIYTHGQTYLLDTEAHLQSTRDSVVSSSGLLSALEKLLAIHYSKKSHGCV